MRTMFVNPSFINPRRKRGKKGKRHSKRRARRHGYRMTRRNAGITPFVQNPLILSNPRKRRSRRRNPMAIPSMRTAFDTALSSGGGAILALTVNTMGTSKINNVWGRRAAQLGVAILGGSLLSSRSAKLSGAFTGAMMYPLAQDVAADLLGIGVGAGAASAKEADIEALAADLEDVLDDMDDDDELSGDDDEEYAW